MENIRLRNVGRPKLQIDNITADVEIEKYLKGQKAIDTYRNIGISKSSFYRLLEKMEIKR